MNEHAIQCYSDYVFLLANLEVSITMEAHFCHVIKSFIKIKLKSVKLNFFVVVVVAIQAYFLTIQSLHLAILICFF